MEDEEEVEEQIGQHRGKGGGGLAALILDDTQFDARLDVDEQKRRLRAGGWGAGFPRSAAGWLFVSDALRERDGVKEGRRGNICICVRVETGEEGGRGSGREGVGEA